MKEREQFLMCPPDFYSVQYVINPWMEGNIHKAGHENAVKQWRALHGVLQEFAQVELITPKAGWPDMVFTANAGVVLGRKVALSRFLHRERRGEEPLFKKWFQRHGFEIFQLPPDLPFEGAGDALRDQGHDWLWAAYGLRTELDTHPLLAQWLGIEVLSLRLVDTRFYHLDTCFCPLDGGHLLYFPAAFDRNSKALIEERVPLEKRIEVPEADAIEFACNAVNIGRRVIVNQAGADLKGRLHDSGFEVIETPLNEFLKSGGAAKCLVLRLTEPPAATPQPRTSIVSKELRLEGHLLDSGLLEKALDATVAGGGSFQVRDFRLGKQRQSSSAAAIRISAPSHAVLEKIMAQMVAFGAMTPQEPEEDATLEPAPSPGVAPEGFYSTTIYPTEIRFGGEWLRVQDQRMDGVIAVSGENPPVARCKLIRQLAPEDRVAVGASGIRALRDLKTREPRARFEPEKEFAFMGADVSSERRVELIVEQIAWEMRRIREQGGRIVVVAGPVVIHTGGGQHLARLIRAGYVQALLGGNAIAAHDIEHAFLGTSLGVDLERGKPIHGGHSHHLRAINIIRRCGGIRQAVEGGVLTRGIFYEYIKKNISFSLAGSIRDDGPLPDTEMNLLKAQEDYARLLKGADMVLMLSSMLHSIGAGNMVPAGVRMVCVDINPAVVTKLSDRGSVESAGIVTDVGLFLNLLEQRLIPKEDRLAA